MQAEAHLQVLSAMDAHQDCSKMQRAAVRLLRMLASRGVL